MNEADIKKLQAMNNKLAADIYYTTKDDEGVIRPLAGLWESSGYGKEAAEERAAKIKTTVITVRIVEIS